jgi:hypothetical protein
VPALLALTVACSPGDSEPVASSAPSPVAAEPRLTAALTQDSRDTARDRIAVVLSNEGEAEVVPGSIEYLDSRTGCARFPQVGSGGSPCR